MWCTHHWLKYINLFPKTHFKRSIECCRVNDPLRLCDTWTRRLSHRPVPWKSKKNWNWEFLSHPLPNTTNEPAHSIKIATLKSCPLTNICTEIRMLRPIHNIINWKKKKKKCRELIDGAHFLNQWISPYYCGTSQSASFLMCRTYSSTLKILLKSFNQNNL